MRPALAAIVFMVLSSFAGESRGAGVDLEVILAADVSRSIDDAEFDLQRKGYAAALTGPWVLTGIRGRSGGAIGVCFIEWSGDEDQQVVVDWTEIRDEEDAGSIAAAILAAPRSFLGRTSISAAIDFAMAHFGTSKWQASRRIIDISGDGTNNSGRHVTEARDQAIARGITINGLAIICRMGQPRGRVCRHAICRSMAGGRDGPRGSDLRSDDVLNRAAAHCGHPPRPPARLPSRVQIEAVAEMLQALGDPQRLRFA